MSQDFSDKESKIIVSEDLQYHLDNFIPINENMFRYGSSKFFSLINECRKLYRSGYDGFNKDEIEIFESDLGKFFNYNGERLPLDFPMEYENNMVMESEYHGKNVELNKPKKGGSKKWYVYVKNPKTGKIKKISYGSPDMPANWNDPKARKSFAARHQCEKKTDKMSAGYWACRAHKDFGKNVTGRYW